MFGVDEVGSTCCQWTGLTFLPPLYLFWGGGCPPGNPPPSGSYAPQWAQSRSLELFLDPSDNVRSTALCHVCQDTSPISSPVSPRGVGDKSALSSLVSHTSHFMSCNLTLSDVLWYLAIILRLYLRHCNLILRLPLYITHILINDLMWDRMLSL